MVTTTTRQVSPAKSPQSPASPTGKGPTDSKKVKNKVGSSPIQKIRVLEQKPVECYSSDKDNNSDHENKEQSTEPVPSVATNPSRQQLPKNLQKQLLLDIQKAGGIQVAHLQSPQGLSELLNLCPHIYGERGDPLREKLRKKVWYWRHNFHRDPKTWTDVLIKFEVLERPQAVASNKKKETPRPSIGLEPREVQQEEVLETLFPVQNKMTVQYPSGTVIIPVDLTRPENNGPFNVYEVPDMKAAKDGTKHKGFYIVLEVDTKFMDWDEEVEWWSACVVGHKHIQFKVPAWSYVMFPKVPLSTEFDASIGKQVEPAVFKSMNDAHSAIDDNATASAEGRKWKHIVLDFTKVKKVGDLSSKAVFEEAGTKEMLDFDIIEVKGEGTATSTLFGFKVGYVDPEGAGARKIQRKHPTMSKAAEKRRRKQEAIGGDVLMPKVPDVLTKKQ